MLLELRECERWQVERLLDAVGGHDLRAGIQEAAGRQVDGRGAADGVGQHLDRQVALHERRLAEADVGVAGLDLGQVLGGQVVAAGHERRARVGGLELAEAGDVRRAQADEGLGVRVGRQEGLPGRVVLVRRDLDVEWAEDLDAGCRGERLLHALGPVLEDREAREAVADDDLAGRGSRHRASQGPSGRGCVRLSTERSPTYGALTEVTSRLNCTIGVPPVDDLVESAGHRLARDGRRDALDAGRRRATGPAWSWARRCRPRDR